MNKIACLVIGLFLTGQAASAATWSIISFTAEPQNAAGVVAAADALMSSKVGKEFPGRLFLQVNVADGTNPATHSFVPVYNTAADREAFVQKMQADPAWTKFQASMTKLTTPVSNTMYRTAQRWGEISDDDHVWRAHMFEVRDPAAFVAALQKFMGSETGKKFPGQVFLSAVVAGGMTPVTHVISVGQESEAAIEAWESTFAGNADWAAWQKDFRAVADYLGNNMVRDVKTWGTSLDEATR